jgi:hypothetical protein
MWAAWPVLSGSLLVIIVVFEGATVVVVLICWLNNGTLTATGFLTVL